MARGENNSFELLVLVSIVAIVGIVGVFGFLGLQMNFNQRSDLAGYGFAKVGPNLQKATTPGVDGVTVARYGCSYVPVLVCDNYNQSFNQSNGTGCYNTTMLVCDRGAELHRPRGESKGEKIT